jgi:hypothetical protein
MAVDYYSLLTKAVADKDAAARDKIYNDAFGVIKRSHLPREAASSEVTALRDAIRRVEDDIAAQEAREGNEAAISKSLSTGSNWKPFVIGACAVVAVVAVSALLYRYAAVTASSPKVAGAREDVVMADLKAGVDGGSTSERLPFALQRQVVFYRTTVVPGSIVIDRENRFLYLIGSSNSARRYGIGIAQECLKGGSFFRVTNKLEWPDWRSSGANTKDADALIGGPPGRAIYWGRARCCWTSPGLSFTGQIRPKPSVISSRPGASDS